MKPLIIIDPDKLTCCIYLSSIYHNQQSIMMISNSLLKVNVFQSIHFIIGWKFKHFQCMASGVQLSCNKKKT